MSVLTQRVHQKNAQGGYDVLHFETDARVVLMPDGTPLYSAVKKIIDMSYTVPGVPEPSAALTYTGSDQSPTWLNYEASKMTISGTTHATNAGTYSATFTLNDGFWWPDGTCAPKTVSWTINRATIANVPSQSGSLTWTGASQSPTWSNYNSNVMSYGGTKSGTAAGSYNAEFTPDANHKWSDGTTTKKTVAWTIGRATIANVPSQKTALTFTGSEQTVSWNNYDSNIMTIGGTVKGTNATTYTATFTPDANHKWSDGSTTAKNVNWSIGKLSVTIPAATGTSKTYSGSAQGPTISGYDSNRMTKTGTESATNVGDYTITYTLKDTTNTQWSDGTIVNKSISWSIAKLSVTIPTATNTSLTYSGSAQGPTVSNYNSSHMTKSGTESSTNAGSWTITYKLNDTTNKKWSDGTTTDKTISWSIAKAAGSLSLSKTSHTFTAKNTSTTVTATRAGNGTVNATSSNTNVATVSVSGTTITITAGSTSGTCTINVTVAEGTNHTAVTTAKTVSITASYLISVPTTVGSTFTFGKHSINGEAKWDITWQVVHVVTGAIYAMPSDIIDLRCFDAPESGNSDSNRRSYGNNRYACSNIRQWLNSRKTSGWFSTAAEDYHIANSTDKAPNTTNNPSYHYGTSYESRPGFATAFSDAEWDQIMPVTLTIAKNTVTDGGGSETVTDKVWLPTIYQMGLGKENNIQEGDGVQFSYFTGNTQRIKHMATSAFNATPCTNKPSAASTAWYYWCSSPYSGSSLYARLVGADGTLYFDAAAVGYYGVCPCIKIRTS